MGTGIGDQPDPFEHVGLLYRDEGEYTRACAEFVGRGLAAGDPILVAVPDADRIARVLGSDAGYVRFADMTVVGRNPGRIIPWVLWQFAEAHSGRKVWIIGEPVWSGRSPIEYPACGAHEALINTVFRGRRVSMMCPYDAIGLDTVTIEDAWRTHPLVTDWKGTRSSAAYGDPIATAAGFNRPLPQPPSDARRYSYSDANDLTGLRAIVARLARTAGVDADRVPDAVLAINELAANTIEHTTDGAGTLTMWSEPGVFVCQIDDRGHLTDPMAGRLPPSVPGRGLGLAVVNRLTDLLRIYSHPGGTSLRIHVAADNYHEHVTPRARSLSGSFADAAPEGSVP